MKNSKLVNSIYNNKKDNKKTSDVVYSKKGFLIEYPKFTKIYVLYLLRRGLAFSIDYIIPGILQYTLWKVIKLDIIIGALFTLIYYHFYIFILLTITNGKTIGLWLAKMRVVHKSGFVTNFKNYYFRAFLQSIFALPWIGWGLMILNLVFIFFTRAINLLDVLSSTIVITDLKYKEIIEIEKELLEKEKDDN